MKNRRSAFGWKTIVVILFIVSNLSFATSVKAGWPDVIFPSAEGITLVEGNMYTILWKSVRVDPVNIALCTEDPGYSYCFYAIAMNVPNSGSYSWTVPANLTKYSNYTIMVGLIGVSVGGSDYPFIISDSVLDSDSDGIPDNSDSCPTTYNTNQTDSDYDGVGDDCEPTSISGNVTYKNTPVCAMVLANGQYQFTCSGDGSFDIDDPLDSNGQVTIFSLGI